MTIFTHYFLLPLIESINMVLSSLKALTGDSFVISWEGNAIIIDGGMPKTHGEIVRNLNQKKLRAVFITHVDYDHIGGIINLIRESPNDFPDCQFFMNNPELACHYKGTEVKYSHGDTLQQMLEQKGNKFLPSTSSSTPLEISGLKITTLLPSNELCQTLCDNWDASRIIDEQKKMYSYLERQKNNGDIINKSSICLIVQRDNKKALMLGDSHPDDVADSLSKHEVFEFDMVKLSHHGSLHNTNSRLLELLKCNRYFISTNGNKYDHPDSETIHLLSQKALAKNEIYSVYLNYDLEEKIRKKYREKYHSEIRSLNFIYQQDVAL